MRYYVFGYDQYYPSGGMSDCIYRCKDLQTAKMFLKELKRRDFKNRNGWSMNHEIYDVWDMKKNKQSVSIERYDIEKL